MDAKQLSIAEYANFLESPFDVEVDGIVKRFNPNKWERVGFGFHIQDEYWEVRGGLYRNGKSWFLIERLQPTEADCVFSNFFGVHLSNTEAAKWCALHDVPIPKELETIADDFQVLPSQKTESVSAVPKGISELAESELDEIDDRIAGQGLNLFRFLRSRKHWATYESLQTAKGVFQKPNSSDETIETAIKRLKNSLIKLGALYDVEYGSRRAKLVCLVADKQRDK